MISCSISDDTIISTRCTLVIPGTLCLLRNRAMLAVQLSSSHVTNLDPSPQSAVSFRSLDEQNHPLKFPSPALSLPFIYILTSFVIVLHYYCSLRITLSIISEKHITRRCAVIFAPDAQHEIQLTQMNLCGVHLQRNCKLLNYCHS